MVFSDDTAVDGSILRVTAAQAIGGCPSGSNAGLFSFTATLKNLVSTTFDNIRIVVDHQATTSGIQLLLPNGVSDDASLSDLTPNRISTLQGGAAVTVPFSLCLPSLTPFNFFVDVTATVPAQ
jgi:hypothetical protein